MAFLTSKQETNRIVLYRSTSSRWESLGFLVFWSVLVSIVFPPSRWDIDTIPPGGWIYICLFVMIPLSWAITEITFSTTIVIDGQSQLLRRFKSFLAWVYYEREISFTDVVKIQVTDPGSPTQAYHSIYSVAAILRDGQTIKLNWRGYASEIFWWAGNIAEMICVPVEECKPDSFHFINKLIGRISYTDR